MPDDKGEEKLNSGAEGQIANASSQTSEDLGFSGENRDEVEKKIAELLGKATLQAQREALAKQQANIAENMEPDTVFGESGFGKPDEPRSSEKKAQTSHSEQKAITPGDLPTGQSGIERADQSKPTSTPQKTGIKDEAPETATSGTRQQPEPGTRQDPEKPGEFKPLEAPQSTDKYGRPMGASRSDQPTQESKPQTAETPVGESAEQPPAEEEMLKRANRLQTAKRQAMAQQQALAQQQEQQNIQAGQAGGEKIKNKIKRLKSIQLVLKIMFGISTCCSSCLTLTIIFGVLGFIWGAMAFVFLLLPIILLGMYIVKLRIKRLISKK